MKNKKKLKIVCCVSFLRKEKRNEKSIMTFEETISDLLGRKLEVEDLEEAIKEFRSSGKCDENWYDDAWTYVPKFTKFSNLYRINLDKRNESKHKAAPDHMWNKSGSEHDITLFMRIPGDQIETPYVQFFKNWMKNDIYHVDFQRDNNGDWIFPYWIPNFLLGSGLFSLHNCERRIAYTLTLSERIMAHHIDKSIDITAESEKYGNIEYSDDYDQVRKAYAKFHQSPHTIALATIKAGIIVDANPSLMRKVVE